MVEELVERELRAIEDAPAGVRPHVLHAFGLGGDIGPRCCFVMPHYQALPYFELSEPEQLVLALAAADVAWHLWTKKRLHLDLKPDVFYADPLPAGEERLVVLDYNDVYKWPPSSNDSMVSLDRFGDPDHPDLRGRECGRDIGALAQRIQGLEDRLLSFSMAHLLALSAGIRGPSPGGEAPNAKRDVSGRLAARFSLMTQTAEILERGLRRRMADRPPLQELIHALADAAADLPLRVGGNGSAIGLTETVAARYLALREERP